MMPQRLAETTEQCRMVITLKSYLARLREEESGRPEIERRAVPSIDELARAAKVNRVTLSNIANNRIALLNLRVCSRLIAELRGRGFATTASDVLIYEEH